MNSAYLRALGRALGSEDPGIVDEIIVEDPEFQAEILQDIHPPAPMSPAQQAQVDSRVRTWSSELLDPES